MKVVDPIYTFVHGGPLEHPAPAPSAIPEILGRMMAEEKISRSEAADLFGISDTQVSNILRGRYQLPSDSIARLKARFPIWHQRLSLLRLQETVGALSLDSAAAGARPIDELERDLFAAHDRAIAALFGLESCVLALSAGQHHLQLWYAKILDDLRQRTATSSS